MAKRLALVIIKTNKGGKEDGAIWEDKIYYDKGKYYLGAKDDSQRFYIAKEFYNRIKRVADQVKEITEAEYLLVLTAANAKDDPNAPEDRVHTGLKWPTE